MNRIESAIKSISMTGWFIKASWQYITTKHMGSKLEFFVGIIPAWFRFTVETYKDCRSAI